ncbi:hypothetical protein K435DRAFT_866704 [Dendrothele bispora CBS 962.96]|uniref:Uncharacterized protein n=1 Tax=Dendrothele bispora (strain CBS 962.96) TaxID=1314807 RepID=A0A4S8LG51_DENBC|nr:hypothetical protein K435DRAFT_866704 [Dendrothele bispora CBS 962.96]
MPAHPSHTATARGRRLSRNTAVPIRRTVSAGSHSSHLRALPRNSDASRNRWFSAWIKNNEDDANDPNTVMIQGFLHPNDCGQHQVLVEVSHRVIPNERLGPSFDFHILRVRAWIPAPYASGLYATPSPRCIMQTHLGNVRAPQWTRLLTRPVRFRQDRGQVAILFNQAAYGPAYEISTVTRGLLLDWAKLASVGTWAEDQAMFADRELQASFPHREKDSGFEFM